MPYPFAIPKLHWKGLFHSMKIVYRHVILEFSVDSLEITGYLVQRIECQQVVPRIVTRRIRARCF